MKTIYAHIYDIFMILFCLGFSSLLLFVLLNYDKNNIYPLILFIIMAILSILTIYKYVEDIIKKVKIKVIKPSKDDLALDIPGFIFIIGVSIFLFFKATQYRFILVLLIVFLGLKLMFIIINYFVGEENIKTKKYKIED